MCAYYHVNVYLLLTRTKKDPLAFNVICLYLYVSKPLYRWNKKVHNAYYI